GGADPGLCLGRLSGAARALRHRSRPPRPAGSARCPRGGGLRRASAPHDALGPPARPGRRRRRRRRVPPARGRGQREAEPRAGHLLGPDAVGVAVDEFRRLGAEVIVRPSPWRLGAAESELAAEWLTGWVDAACEQEPEMAPAADRYRRRRLREAAAGVLTVTV